MSRATADSGRCEAALACVVEEDRTRCSRRRTWRAPMEPHVNSECTAWGARTRFCGIVELEAIAERRAAEIAAQKRPDAGEGQIHSQYHGRRIRRRGGVDYVGERGGKVAKALDVPVPVRGFALRRYASRHVPSGVVLQVRRVRVDAEGWPVAWETASTLQLIRGANKSTEGVRDEAYTIPNFTVDYHEHSIRRAGELLGSVGYRRIPLRGSRSRSRRDGALGRKRSQVEVRARFCRRIRACWRARNGRREAGWASHCQGQEWEWRCYEQRRATRNKGQIAEVVGGRAR